MQGLAIYVFNDLVEKHILAAYGDTNTLIAFAWIISIVLCTCFQITVRKNVATSFKIQQINNKHKAEKIDYNIKIFQIKSLVT